MKKVYSRCILFLNIFISLAVIFSLVSCDLVNPAVVDKIKSESNRTNPADSGFWERLADFPLKKHSDDEQMIWIGDKLFVGLIVGGLSEGHRICYIYDLNTDTWKKAADYPGENQYAPLYATLGGDVYSIGGRTSNDSSVQLSEAWKYESLSDEWIRIADLPMGTTIENQSSGVGLTVALNMLHIVTSNKLYIYDPGADVWEYKEYSDIENPIDGPIGSIININCGSSESGVTYSIDAENILYIYNPVSNTSTAGPLLPPELIGSGIIYYVIDNSLFIYKLAIEATIFSLPLDKLGNEAEAIEQPKPPSTLFPNGYMIIGCSTGDSLFYIAKGWGFLGLEPVWVEGRFSRLKP